MQVIGERIDEWLIFGVRGQVRLQEAREIHALGLLGVRLHLLLVLRGLGLELVLGPALAVVRAVELDPRLVELPGTR